MTFFYDYITYGYLYDIQNQEYTKTSKFSFLISEIDGNAITHVIKDDKIYVFHSHTEYYETGVFIYDIKTNTWNAQDFMPNPLYVENNNDDDDTEEEPCNTNRFKTLHQKDILSCHVYNHQLLLNVHDGETCGIYQYDIETDTLVKLFETVPLFETQITNDILYGYHYSERHGLHTYDLINYQHNIISFCDKNELVRYWDMSIRLILTEKYVNPYGQIYKENRDDEAPSRQRKIKFI